MATKAGRATGVLEADGNTDEVRTRGSALVHVSGTFGGGAIGIQRLVGNAFVNVTDDGAAISFTAANDVLIELRGSNVVRGVLAGSTSPELTWEIVSYEP